MLKWLKMITVNIISVSTPVDVIYQFCDLKCFLKLSSIPFNLPSVQVSKTDPSPKREMPTMILFNVVFALRVRKVAFFVILHLFHSFKKLILVLWVWSRRVVFVSDKTLCSLSENSQELSKRRVRIILLNHAACQSQLILPVLSPRTSQHYRKKC